MLARSALGLAFALALSAPCLAQPVEVLFQGVINSKGKDCPRVTALKPIGKSTSGSAVIAAACSNGSRHVIEIKPDRSLKYISSCSIFEGTSGKSCF